MPELKPADGEQLHGGYLNSVVRHGGSVRKVYLGTRAGDRCRTEFCALTHLAPHLSVPRVLHYGGDQSLMVEFVQVVNGQHLLHEGHAALALHLCGNILRRLQAVDVATVNGELPGAGDVIAHGDFGPQNVLIQTTDETVGTVIDWEFCHFGDPIEDLAWAEWIVRRHQRKAIEFLPELFTGYGSEPDWIDRRHSMIGSLRRMRESAVENGDSKETELWDERIADTAAWGRSEFQAR